MAEMLAGLKLKKKIAIQNTQLFVYLQTRREWRELLRGMRFTSGVSYAYRCHRPTTACMAAGIRPASGRVTVLHGQCYSDTLSKHFSDSVIGLAMMLNRDVGLQSLQVK